MLTPSADVEDIFVPARPEPEKKDDPLSYVLPVDYGIRVDKAGKGGFRASRTHGEHNGLDLLAEVGTPVLAFCSGRAQSGTTGTFGNWVKLVCPLPRSLGGPEAGYLSVFYAHLSAVSVSAEWQSVRTAEQLGAVGKTGNASGSAVEPHLHLEMIIADDEPAALSETHSGLVQTSNWAVARFLSRLTRGCLVPDGFAPLEGELQRGRRVDPFLVQSCLVTNKPLLAPAPSPLGAARFKWSDRYRARGFDVDRGRVAPLSAAKEPELGLGYFAGAWSGESRGTQVFAELRIAKDGQFVTNVQAGPDSRCSDRGKVTLAGELLTFAIADGNCASAETRFASQRVIDVGADEFAMAQAELPDPVERLGTGELQGPVWVFQRK